MMKRRRKKGGMGVGLFRVAIILLFGEFRNLRQSEHRLPIMI